MSGVYKRFKSQTVHIPLLPDKDGEPNYQIIGIKRTFEYDDNGIRILQLNYNLYTDNDWKGNSGNGNSSTETTGTSESGTTANTSTGTTNDNNGNATGNTNNTGGSQNQSGILFPIGGEVSELESELTGMIKTSTK